MNIGTTNPSIGVDMKTSISNMIKWPKVLKDSNVSITIDRDIESYIPNKDNKTVSEMDNAIDISRD